MILVRRMSGTQQREAWGNEARFGQISANNLCRGVVLLTKIQAMIPSSINRLVEQPCRVIGWLLFGKTPGIIGKIVQAIASRLRSHSIAFINDDDVSFVGRLVVISLLIYLVYRTAAMDLIQQFEPTIIGATILLLAVMTSLQYPSQTAKGMNILRYWVEINLEHMAVLSHINTLQLAKSFPGLQGFRVLLQVRRIDESISGKRLLRISSTVYLWCEIVFYFLVKSSLDHCTDLLIILSLLEIYYLE